MIPTTSLILPAKPGVIVLADPFDFSSPKLPIGLSDRYKIVLSVYQVFTSIHPGARRVSVGFQLIQSGDASVGVRPCTLRGKLSVRGEQKFGSLCFKGGVSKFLIHLRYARWCIKSVSTPHRNRTTLLSAGPNPPIDISPSQQQSKSNGRSSTNSTLSPPSSTLPFFCNP